MGFGKNIYQKAFEGVTFILRSNSSKFYWMYNEQIQFTQKWQSSILDLSFSSIFCYSILILHFIVKTNMVFIHHIQIFNAKYKWYIYYY